MLAAAPAQCSNEFCHMAAQANFGESLKVVGSNEALGNWDVSRSPSMTWTDGDVWRLELALPPGEQIHFKVRDVPVRICGPILGADESLVVLYLVMALRATQCAKTNGDWVDWEQTSDRSVQVAVLISPHNRAIMLLAALGPTSRCQNLRYNAACYRSQVPDDAVSALSVAWNWNDNTSLSIDTLSNGAAAQSPAVDEPEKNQVSVLAFVGCCANQVVYAC